jgi:hypothetical protein
LNCDSLTTKPLVPGGLVGPPPQVNGSQNQVLMTGS